MNYRKNEDKWPCITITDNKGMEVEVVEDLEAEPVTLAEAKSYLNIDGTDFDSVLPSLITTARIMCEKYSGYSFGEKTLKLYLDEYNSNRFTLPYGPVESIEAVTSDGDAITLTDGYELTGNKRIKVLTGSQNLVVTYKTKEIDFATKKQYQWMKGAILAQLTFLNEHRGDETGEQVCELAQVIMSPHMILNVF